MSLSKEELRKSVEDELCEALRYAERAANLLRRAKENCSLQSKKGEAFQMAKGLALVVRGITEHIDHLLSE